MAKIAYFFKFASECGIYRRNSTFSYTFTKILGVNVKYGIFNA